MDTHMVLFHLGGKYLLQDRLVGIRHVPYYTDYFAEQAGQALRNIISILNAADEVAEHNTRLTWFIIRKKEYLASLKSLGQKYREEVG